MFYDFSPPCIYLCSASLSKNAGIQKPYTSYPIDNQGCKTTTTKTVLCERSQQIFFFYQWWYLSMEAELRCPLVSQWRRGPFQIQVISLGPTSLWWHAKLRLLLLPSSQLQNRACFFMSYITEPSQSWNTNLDETAKVVKWLALSWKVSPKCYPSAVLVEISMWDYVL